MMRLINRVTTPERYLAEAIALAKRIAEKPPITVRSTKEAVLKAAERPLSVGIQYERNSFLRLFATEDTEEGIGAFLGKRRPRFVGR